MQSDSELMMTLKDEQSAMFTQVRNRAAYYFVKRVMDLVIAVSLLLLLSPLLLLIAVAILVYSQGPILFVQERVGAKRQPRSQGLRWEKTTFLCYKFRTMHIESDPLVHKAYVSALIAGDKEKMTILQGGLSEIRKLVHDPRITRPGKFLRKASLDELPQLLNVVRGEMSLVGPRPAIPYEVEMYKPWHLKRLEAQPGITGLQQVTARSTADFDEQVQLDIDYIQHQSLWLDLKIMLKTPLVVLSTRGAE